MLIEEAKWFGQKILAIEPSMCYYLLLSYIKYQTKYSYSLLELSWIFSEVVFEKISLIDLLSCKYYNIYKVRDSVLQQILF